MQQIKGVLRFLILLFSDLIAIYVANYIGLGIRLLLLTYTPYTVPDNLPPILGPFYPSWIWIVFISMSILQRLHTSILSFWDETRKIVNTALVSFVIVTSISFIARWYDMDTRFLAVITSLFYIPIAIATRVLVKYVMYLTKYLTYTASLITDSVESKKILYTIARKNRSLLISIRQIVIIKDYSQGTLERVKIKISRSKIDLSIIYLEKAPEEFFSKLVSNIHSSVRRMMVVPNISSMPLLNSEMMFIINQNIPFISLRNNLLVPINRFFKRAFDIVFSIIALAVSLPIIGILSLLIVLESPGWPIYKSRRVKMNGEEFYCYKLRSMYQDAEKRLNEILEKDPSKKEEWLRYRKLKDDPRITKVGRIIRKLSLDELPQFINVLIGDMSVVGPRAITKEEIDRYYKDEAKFYYYAVRPGITGLWQVSGRNEMDYNLRVRTDIWYVENWSFWLDIVIILKTIPAVFKSEGAY